MFMPNIVAAAKLTHPINDALALLSIITSSTHYSINDALDFWVIKFN